MAIASKIVDQQVVVIDDLSFESPATREMAAILKALGLAGVSTLVATADDDANVYKSARNIPQVSVSPVSDLNALSVLTPRRMLVTKAALDAIKERADGVAWSAWLGAVSVQPYCDRDSIRWVRQRQSKQSTSREKKIKLLPHQVVLRPLVTEKGMHRATRNNQYAFEVNPLADKDGCARGGRDVV